MVQARACKALYSGSIPLAASIVLAGQGPSAKSGGSLERGRRDAEMTRNSGGHTGPIGRGCHKSSRAAVTVERREWAGTERTTLGVPFVPDGRFIRKRRESDCRMR